VARCVRWAERRTTTTSVHVIKATFAWATAKPPLPAPRLWIFRRQPFLGAPRQLLIVIADPGILHFESGSVSSSAVVRASSARSRQCLGSLIGTLATNLHTTGARLNPAVQRSPGASRVLSFSVTAQEGSAGPLNSERFRSWPRTYALSAAIASFRGTASIGSLWEVTRTQYSTGLGDLGKSRIE
jgi:hypothetical protein